MENESSLTVKWANTTDVRKILSLFKAVSPQYPRSILYYQWAHNENPHGKSDILIAKKKEKIIGHLAISKLVGDDGKILGNLQQVLVHPNYRDFTLTVTLLKEMNKMLKEKYNYSIAFPNNNFAPVLEKIGKWKYIKNISETIFNLQKNSFNNKTIEWNNYFLEQSNFDLDFDDGIWSKKSNYGSKIAKSKNWFVWRFLKHPTEYYDIFVTKNNGKIDSYIVTKIFLRKDGNLVGHILDVSGIKLNNIETLINVVINYFNFNNCSFLTVWETSPFVSNLRDLLPECNDSEKTAVNTNYYTNTSNDIEKQYLMNMAPTMALSDVY